MSIKLHQLLAIEDDRKRTGISILNETAVTFRTKKDHFDGKTRSYQKKEESGEDYATERKAVITSVTERLDYTVQHWKRYLDAVLQKEETNASGAATAELIIREFSFGTFAATSLLAIEKNLVQFIEMLRVIPTLDPSIEWEIDGDVRGQYKAKYDEIQTRSAKKQEPIVLYDATKEHPAQVQMGTYDVIIGTWTAKRVSAKISSGEKALMLDRAEELLIGVKKARTKANECGVVPVQSSKFFTFITTGKA